MWTALQEHRGRNRCWQLSRVESSEFVTKTEPCLSTLDQVDGLGTVVKVSLALTHTKLSERIGEARALSYSYLCRCIVYGSYGFVMPKPCGRIVGGSYGFVMPVYR